MIAYRAEIWCNTRGCVQGVREGIAHDDFQALPGLAQNQAAILIAEGWTIEGDRHFCPSCSRKRALKGSR